MKMSINSILMSVCLILNLKSVYGGILTNILNESGEEIEILKEDLYLIQDKLNEEKVDIKLFYECHCPGCREFESGDFKKTIERLNTYLTVKTYPYGNAETLEKDNKIEFVCQHGPPECYGNMLHACALDIVKNHTAALIFNSCMMDFSQEALGSDDNAADKCGTELGIDSSPIKSCAKGNKGVELLKYYGEESLKMEFQYVPYVLINGKEYTGDNFFEDVCKTFSHPPPPCAKYLFFN